MNRKEYKLLVEGWNNYLNEIASDISGVTKIKSFVDRIVALRKETGKDIKVKVHMSGNVLKVSLLNYSTMRMNSILYQKAWLNHHGLVSRDVKVEGERDPFVVKYSEVGGGFGPLLYEVGLEVVSCMLNGALMSDRQEVSPEAERVWARYKRRADSEFNINAVKMDFSSESWEDVMYDPPFSNMSKEEQDKFKATKKLTPDDETDDIYQMSAILNSADVGNFVDGDWNSFESPLAYAFYKSSDEIIQYMKDLDEAIIEIDV